MPLTFNWDALELAALIRAALDEDIGTGDATCAAIVPPGATARARLIAKQDAILAGLPLFERVFRALDPALEFRAHFEEGARLTKGTTVAELAGRAVAILTAERTALNFLAHLSGIATLTWNFTSALAGSNVRIRDTRKTTPLLRALEKYAVRAGGGSNHRFGLYDAILIKENHIAVAGGITSALGRAREYASRPRETTAYESWRPPGPLPVQIEVRNEAELREALAAGADSILLDNLAPHDAAALVAVARQENSKCVVELSGGITGENLLQYAAALPDFIAIGALTHSAPAADFSLLVQTRPPE